MSAGLAVLLVGLTLTQPAGSLSSTDRQALERLALAKARTDIHRQVTALRILDDLTVGQWAQRDAALDRALRGWTRALPREGNLRIYSDSTCDADVRLDPADLSRQITSWLTEFPKSRISDKPTAADVSAAARRWPELWGSATADLSDQDSHKPEGWENVGPEGVQLARLAASADAVHALLDEAAALKVTAARRLAEFLDASPAVRSAVLEGLRTSASVRVETAPDQVAVAEARISMGDLIRILTEVHQQHYKDELFRAADFREMALTADRSELRGAGLAVPPDRYVHKPEYALIELDAPAWVDRKLTGTGRYRPRDGEDFSPAARLEQARFDAINQLRQQVEALVIQRDVTVERFLAYRPKLKDDVVLFLSGARTVGTPNTPADGGVDVRVELPLRRLWWIVRRGMEQVEVEPASAPASRPESEIERTGGNQP